MQSIKQEKGHYQSQGLRARARPNLVAPLLAFGSYSPETVISDLGLHSLWHSIANFPLFDNLVFTMV